MATRRPTTKSGRKTGKPVGRPSSPEPLTERVQFRTTASMKNWLDNMDNKSSWLNAIIAAAMDHEIN